MIKLADLIELQMQPGESTKMKNFLYRGNRDQIAQAEEPIMKPYDDEGSTTYSKMKGTVEEEPLVVKRPENTQRIVTWNWKEDSTLEELGTDTADMKDALLGRELQTLQDVKKLIKRLKDRGYTRDTVIRYVMQYLDILDEDIAYATITKPAVSGGLTQDTE